MRPNNLSWSDRFYQIGVGALLTSCLVIPAASVLPKATQYTGTIEFDTVREAADFQVFLEAEVANYSGAEAIYNIETSSPPSLTFKVMREQREFWEFPYGEYYSYYSFADRIWYIILPCGVVFVVLLSLFSDLPVGRNSR